MTYNFLEYLVEMPSWTMIDLLGTAKGLWDAATTSGAVYYNMFPNI